MFTFLIDVRICISFASGLQKLMESELCIGHGKVEACIDTGNVNCTVKGDNFVIFFTNQFFSRKCFKVTLNLFLDRPI